ncbi:adenine-specific DNA-methyltransferase [Vreelandella songnenensis]|uniref:site-specific DNA-methyltransferase (adenine-specific) n=1 Tax=Vreelandella songnenensis TaxID=1176243 RepID=A0A2T0V5V0_9GAMM|nr:site-specific DNA-methyltransferase [Halomonas songnenensis]PRY65569.1 adenine-specific DNA-methyltransferase [Halomonas songnenensis]
MDKLKMHSPNLTEGNIAKLAELFPSCVTEARDEHGKVKQAIDFDQLRQELSDHIVEGPQERYHLNWPGKRDALLAANAPIAKTLRPCREESVDFDSTKNLFIEGDNLEALKLLQETYLGKVKMIYIDPPYNTGNDFIYSDDFSERKEDYFLRSVQVNEENERLVANLASNGRFHSDWLSMMYSRIKLARNLLSEDGAVFVSIDDNESSNIIKIMSEVFGEQNFVAQLAVQLNPRGRHLDRYVASTHESIVVFVKDTINTNAIHGVEKEGRMEDEYNKKDENGPYRLLGLRNRNQSFNPETRPNLYYPIYVDPQSESVSLIKDDKYSIEVWPDAPDGIKTCWTWGKDKVRKESSLLCAVPYSSEWRIFRKDYLLGTDGEKAKSLVKSLWIDKEFTNDYGRKSVKDLFGSAVMDFPKSPYLLERLVQIGSHKDSLVMDFFSGSSTLAHSIMNVNANDGGDRRFVMVQLPEKVQIGSKAEKAGCENIAELGRERIRRAGEKILESDFNSNWGKDIGFRVLKVDSSNLQEVYYQPGELRQDMLSDTADNIRPDRTPEDLLFQVLLDWGVDLSLSIEQKDIAGKTVYFVDGSDKHMALAACFDLDIDEAFVKQLADYEPLRAVFRDAGFANDGVKINVEQVFAQKSPNTDVKVI